MFHLNWYIGYDDGWKYVKKLLSETAKSYPGVKIHVAVPTSSDFHTNVENVIVNKIDLNETRKLHKNHYRYKFEKKDGYVWQQLLTKVNTSYTFVALDLLVIDSKDINLIRMVWSESSLFSQNVTTKCQIYKHAI